MENQLELREKIMQYLAGNLPLSAIEDWLVPSLWEKTDERSELLATNVLRLLAEYSRKDRSMEELNQELRSLATTYIHSDPMIFTTGTTSSFNPTYRLEWPSADIQSVKAFSLQPLP